MYTAEFAKVWSKLAKDYKLHMEGARALVNGSAVNRT